MELHATCWGDGPRVLLVHGSVTGGADTWGGLRPLASEWGLVAVDRRGYHPNPPAADGIGEDFERDAGDIAELLSEPTHLVGHSYGGVVALLAAARRPDMVRSLTVSEPPAFAVCPDHPAAQAFTRDTVDFWARGPAQPTDFLRAFLAHVGSAVQPPDPMPEPLAQNARMLRWQRLPMEAAIPIDVLRDARFPVLVVSGGHSAAFDAVCDTLEAELQATRAVCAGAGHSVPRAPGYNAALGEFLSVAHPAAS